MDHVSRLKALLLALSKNNLDALLVTHMPNVRYLCGFTGSSGVLLVTPKSVTFLTDGRYTEQATQQVKGAKIVTAKGAPVAGAAKLLTRLRGTVGFESDHTSVSARESLQKLFPKPVRLKAVQGIVENLRLVKDEEELSQIRAAVNVGSELFRSAIEAIRPGVRESQVAAEIEYAARRSGAEKMSFETIVASGQRSALPHGVASSSPIAAKGFVILDYGVILHGYCSDMTRTVHVGRVPLRARQIYRSVLQAQEAAIAAVAPGVEVGKVDAAARSVLRKAKLDRYFTHSTGHGVGLEIHEHPRVARGQTEVLGPGMVITIEPGVYLPGTGGVRIEDMVVVTERGCEILTPTTKELIEI
jgi:Xaa-Pro aminopeptidase